MISIVIPAWNEEERLAKSLPEIISYFKGIGISNYEIIVVDDGSTDSTRNIAKKYNCTLTPPRENRGKGCSVKEGVMMAKGTHVLLTDCDLATPISYFDEFIKFIPQYDIVIASRALKESQVTTSWFKRIMGRLANIPISLLIHNIKDSQCGFKLFDIDAARRIFGKSFIEKWGYDFEILYLAQKLGYKIQEYPVNWTNMPGSKVKLSDYPTTLLELLKIWWHKYD